MPQAWKGPAFNDLDNTSTSSFYAAVLRGVAPSGCLQGLPVLLVPTLPPQQQLHT